MLKQTTAFSVALVLINLGRFPAESSAAPEHFGHNVTVPANILIGQTLAA